MHAVRSDLISNETPGIFTNIVGQSTALRVSFRTESQGMCALSLSPFYSQSLTLPRTVHRNIHKDPISLSSSAKWTNVRKRHHNAIQKLSRTHTSTLENLFATSATIFTPSSIGSVGMTTPKREHILLFCSPTKSSTQHTIINEGREPGGLETDRKTDSVA